jgi:uncharacterized protein YcaQ
VVGGLRGQNGIIHFKGHHFVAQLPIISASAARTLLLDGQGLLADPVRRAGPATAQQVVERLGFVQVDSIQRMERAHHLILGARIDGYRAAHLDHATFRKRGLFEHWTHDASLIPVRWFHHWRPRFERTAARMRRANWFAELGARPDDLLEQVHARIAREGPLRVSDFERPADHVVGWWNWTAEKVALEYLWHTGRLAIRGRDRFQKVYDLTERVFPEAHARAAPSDAEHVEWACAEALDRLGVATIAELRAFFAAVTTAEVRAWSRQAVTEGRAIDVLVESADGKPPRRALATPDWERRLRRAPAPLERLRVLAPFDPLVRDRDRLERLFGFAYRFEAFVPAPKRRYGYYVMPILDGDRVIGRLDPRHDRDAGVIEVEGLWWEPGIAKSPSANAALRRRLLEGLGILATQVGATDVRLPANRR